MKSTAPKSSSTASKTVAVVPSKAPAAAKPAKPLAQTTQTAKQAAKPQPAAKPKAAVKPVTTNKAAPTKASPIKASPTKAPPTKAAPAKAAQVTPNAPAAVADETKPKKAKLVRDSFTIPKAEFAVLEGLKQRAVGLAQPARKSELLRAGIKALAAMGDQAFKAALAAVPAIKTGRPGKVK